MAVYIQLIFARLHLQEGDLNFKKNTLSFCKRQTTLVQERFQLSRLECIFLFLSTTRLSTDRQLCSLGFSHKRAFPAAHSKAESTVLASYKPAYSAHVNICYGFPQGMSIIYSRTSDIQAYDHWMKLADNYPS